MILLPKCRAPVRKLVHGICFYICPLLYLSLIHIYYELGPVLLLPDGNLNEEVGPQKIREYVYYMETKEPLPAEQPTDEPYFMGLCRNTAYYFYYEREHVTTLDHAFLATVQTKSEGYTIYADLCAIPQETLRKHNITFKKIPRDIARL